MAMKIDVYCNDGSPMRVIPPMVYTRGVGGAELSLISWGKTMSKMGHDVRIYNNPVKAGDYDGVNYLSCNAFNPSESRDALIAFRSPNRYIRMAKAAMKIHWSTDQHTVGNFDNDIFPFVDKVVTISPFHRDYHINRYRVPATKVGVIDLGVLVDEYPRDPIQRDPAACLFASVPDRGLDLMRQAWAAIKSCRPDATLTITSDYRLWGLASAGISRYRQSFLHADGVEYLGAVGRATLTDIQAKSSVLSYPSTYDELFCVTVAEAQVAGCVPVTSNTGALGTTNQWGTVLNSRSDGFLDVFVDNVLESMDTSQEKRVEMARAARERFSWQRICRQWETLMIGGDFPGGDM